jgi:hypothetical protein
MGIRLSYVYLSDRDFLRPEEVEVREQRANSAGKKLIHTLRRHRESYLIEPAVLHRLLKRRWEKRHGLDTLPPLLTEEGIKEWFVNFAAQTSNSARSALQTQNEPYLRQDRGPRTLELNEWFDQVYTACVNNREIPYVLLDAKAAMTEFRKRVAQSFSIHFSDRDVFDEFTPDEIQEDVREVVQMIMALFQTDTTDTAVSGPSDSPDIQAVAASAEADRTNADGQPTADQEDLFSLARGD